jgi:hypothetical protein
VENGYTGEILERGINKIVFLIYPADAWVGMIARKDGIYLSCRA